jgi:hypothetical protein
MAQLSSYHSDGAVVGWWTEHEDFAVRLLDELSRANATCVHEVFSEALAEAHALLFPDDRR